MSRALKTDQYKKQKEVFVDTRTTMQQISDDTKAPDVARFIICILIGLLFFVPAGTIVWVGLMLTVGFRATRDPRYTSLPMNLPEYLGKKFIDKHDPKPGGGKRYNKARANFMLGNLIEGDRELWLVGAKLLRHVFLFGTTGSGKTEVLLSILSNFLTMGAGAVFVDAKAAPKLKFQVATLCRYLGREEDYRSIDMVESGAGPTKGHWSRSSNTMNTFSNGTADGNNQVLFSLLPESAGDNQIFLERAQSAMRALMPALVDMRDMKLINIYPDVIAEWIRFKKFVELADGQIVIDGEDMAPKGYALSDDAKRGVIDFLENLPGYMPGKPEDEQGEEVHKGFGFAQTYFVKALGLLSRTYGHIFNATKPEVDYPDVIYQNRILTVLIPSLGRSPSDKKALGNIQLAALTQAMSIGLGEAGTGDIEEMLNNLPADMKVPSCIMVDELAEIMTPGFSTSTSQARGLGISVILATQDLPSMLEQDRKETKQMWANTITKGLGKGVDSETFEEFKKLADEEYAEVSAGSTESNGMVDNYRRQNAASLQKVARLDPLDVQRQGEGQFTFFADGDVHPAQVFFHGLLEEQYITNFRLPSMLPIRPPQPSRLKELTEKINRRSYLEVIYEQELKRDKLKSPIVAAELEPKSARNLWGILKRAPVEVEEHDPALFSPRHERPEFIDDIHQRARRFIQDRRPFPYVGAAIAIADIKSDDLVKKNSSSTNNAPEEHKAVTAGGVGVDISGIAGNPKKEAVKTQRTLADNAGPEGGTAANVDLTDQKWLKDPNEVFDLGRAEETMTTVAALMGIERTEAVEEIEKLKVEASKIKHPVKRVTRDEDDDAMIESVINNLLNN